MSRIVDVRDWNTLRVDSGAFSSLAQSNAEAVETTGAASAVARLETLAVSDCSVALEGSDDGQEFVLLKEIDAPGDTHEQIYLQSHRQFGSSDRLYRLLRWAVKSSGGGDYYASFRIRVVLTGEADGRRLVAQPGGPAFGPRQFVGAPGTVLFQPWIDLEGKGTVSDVQYPIQPIRNWLDTSGMPGYKVVQRVAYASNAELVLESSPYPEELPDEWTELSRRSAAADLEIPVSNVFGDSGGTFPAGGGYLRWRVEPVTPSADWSICFRLEVVPTSHAGQPVSNSVLSR